MPLVAIPNVSEGRDGRRLAEMKRALEDRGARVLDLHTDAVHHRSVFTVTGEDIQLIDAMTELSKLTARIDLQQHQGVHPRLGGLDVCPFVPHEIPMERAVACARKTAEAINEATGLPIYLYGHAARRETSRELPAIRRGGLETLRRRAAHDFPPDIGSQEIDPSRGVVCVGARDVLVAFNVFVEAGPEVARAIAAVVRSPETGLPAVRALGLPIDHERAQVSLNLIDPAVTGIDAAFDAVMGEAAGHRVKVAATEIVGLVPERFMPDPNAKAARLLSTPGRSLESALSS